MRREGPVLTLVTRRGCHLCSEAEALLLREGIPFSAADVDADPELQRLYDFRVPVLVDSTGRLLAEGRIDAATLERVLSPGGSWPAS